MSWNLANEKWIEFTARGAGGDDESGVGDESGLLGQFASGRGLSDLVKLVKASSGYPALSDFLLHGVTDHVAEVREELGRLAEHAPADVASTAKALSELAEGQELIIITNGVS
jgi:hypothetical protein